MTRLDIYLVNNKLAISRSKALELIKNGDVAINEKTVLKASHIVKEEDVVILRDDSIITKYVSRGGLKLQYALDTFNISVEEKVILDIGSSTGGFSDACLQRNAKKIYAIDVGTDQLATKIKNDTRVISLERTHFNKITNELIQDKIDIALIDVSFISAYKAFLKIIDLNLDCEIILLFKPQFEVGKENITKKGVAKLLEIHKKYLREFIEKINYTNYKVVDLAYSPIVGLKEGNIEYLLYISCNFKNKICYSIEDIVNNAHKSLR